MGSNQRGLLLLAAGLVTTIAFPFVALAAEGMPAITINTTSGAGATNTEVYTALKLAFLVSSLVFLPSLLMTATCFTRIAIVLALTRQALGVAHAPPNQVVLGLALFLTFFVMGPIFTDIYDNALVPYSEDAIDHKEALDRAFGPLKTFMLRHTREQDLELFLNIQQKEAPASPEELDALVVVPAFLISELNSAFQIGFLIFLPFLVLDMIVSSVLTSMSMITLPPTVISLPLKLMLFVIIDGWHLVIENLMKSYQA